MIPSVKHAIVASIGIPLGIMVAEVLIGGLTHDWDRDWNAVSAASFWAVVGIWFMAYRCRDL